MLSRFSSQSCGVKAIHACSRLAPNILHFTRWYTNRVSKVLRIELTPVRYRLFASALERVYPLAVSTSPKIHEDNTRTVDTVTGPYAFILRDKARRNHLSTATPTVRGGKTDPTKSRSPRSLVTISGPSCSSTQWAHDTDASSAIATSSVRERAPLELEPGIPGTEPDEEYSVYSRERSPTRLGTKDTFGESIKTSVVLLANEFRGTSSLLIGLKGSEIPEEK